LGLTAQGVNSGIRFAEIVAQEDEKESRSLMAYRSNFENSIILIALGRRGFLSKKNLYRQLED
jgi:hypothetical protein